MWERAIRDRRGHCIGKREVHEYYDDMGWLWHGKV
jgi:predicted alpha-1,6-mannanase (GH76 family)